MPREALIHKRVVRGHQIQDVAILAHDTLEKQRRFALECLPQIVVKIRKLLRQGLHVFQIP